MTTRPTSRCSQAGHELSTCRWVKEKGGSLRGIDCSQAGYTLNRCRRTGVYQGREDDSIFWFELGEKEGKSGAEFIPPDDKKFEFDYKEGYEYGQQQSGTKGTDSAFNQGYEAGMSQCGQCQQQQQIVPATPTSMDFTTWLGGGGGGSGGGRVNGSYMNGDPLPSWLTPPGFDQLTTSAVTTYTNPITGDTYTTSSGGYTVNVQEGGSNGTISPSEGYDAL